MKWIIIAVLVIGLVSYLHESYTKGYVRAQLHNELKQKERERKNR